MFKDNRGITLIALVVTIIILLILAGVSITALSTGGIFSRAESSAAKYQAASEAENSTISSILDQYDEAEKFVQEIDTIPVSWDAPIALRGTYINSANPAASKASNFYDKQIVAIKPSGTTVLLNPYVAQNTKVPNGTKLRFYYYADTNSDYTATIIEDTRGSYARRGWKEHDTKDGTLQYVDVDISDCESVKLTLSKDAIEDWGDNTCSMWYIGSTVELPSMMTVKWTSPIAEMGSKINNVNIDTSRTANFHDKVVIAIEPNGTKHVLDPYSPQSITVPRETVFRFYTYSDKDHERTELFGMLYKKYNNQDGTLIYDDWSEAEEISSHGGFVTKKNYQFYLQWDYAENYDYSWCVDLEPNQQYVS